MYTYCEKTENGNRNFKQGTKRSDNMKLYAFDCELRIIVFTYIRRIENSFKNIFCQITCQKLGDEWWSEKANFHISKSQKSIFKECRLRVAQRLKIKKYTPYKTLQIYRDIVVPMIENIESGKIKNEQVKKYLTNPKISNIPPFRIMIQIFTFGEITHMYNFLEHQQIKKEIGKAYEVDDKILQNRMKVLVDARNICCHHGKLYDKKNRMIVKTKNVPTIEKIILKYENTTYHICCIIFYLLQYIHPDNNFMNDLIILFTKYPNIQTSFPNNWEELRNSAF
jgi:abortive infection bacteriophage resistance protein